MKKITAAVLVIGSIASVSFAGDKWSNNASEPVINYYTGGDKLVNTGSPDGVDQSRERQNNYTGGDKPHSSDSLRKTQDTTPQDSPAQFQGNANTIDNSSSSN